VQIEQDRAPAGARVFDILPVDRRRGESRYARDENENGFPHEWI
jgi:hypothetical protein